MNNRILILIVLLLALLSTSFFLKDEDNKIKDVNKEVKGIEKDSCIDLTKDASSLLNNLPQTRKWYVKSTKIPLENISFNIDLPKENIIVKYSLNETKYLAKYNENWEINIPISSLNPDTYTLMIYISSCDKEISREFTFNVSEPVYVVWSIDWEGFDVKDQYLEEMNRISNTYSLPMTHFFNPYIYIYLNNTRSKYLTEWVKNRTEDRVGLHLHMYNNLVTASGVQVNNNPSWGSTTGNGHDTPNCNYQYEEYKKIILWALDKMTENGFNNIKMYRAGGWYIDEENLQVLNDLGFTLDSSGRDKYIHGSNSLAGNWELNASTQPYKLNSQDQNITNSGNMNIWEFPNNGGDSWALSSEQLISRFTQNYVEGINKDIKVVTYISHPHWFDKEGPKIEESIKYINQYTYSNDSGPVIFTTLDKVYEYTVKHN